jgi:hypothetical protein
MNLSTTLLGSSAVRSLQHTASHPVLQVGSDRFTRHDLAGVECFNFVAAGILSHAFDRLKVKNLREVYDHVAPTMLALPRIGVVSLAVLGARLRSRPGRRRAAGELGPQARPAEQDGQGRAAPHHVLARSRNELEGKPKRRRRPWTTMIDKLPRPRAGVRAARAALCGSRRPR